MFWGSSDQISGFNGNQNLQKTYNRENVVVRTIAPSFLIGYSSNLPETILQTCIKSRTCSISGRIELSASELQWGKCC